MNAHAHDHLTIGDGGIVRCTHCGATHSPHGPTGAPLELWALTALYRAFSAKHADCPPPDGERCDFCHSPTHSSEEHVSATCQRPQDWLSCGDNGLSSKAIWCHMMDLPMPAWDHPCDPSDLGRCVRLLDAPWAAGWRERMGEMAAARRGGKGWTALVPAWAEIEGLYMEEQAGESAPKCYARMRALLVAVGL